jgi:N-acetylglucosamine malate deacetylase 1
MSRLLRRLVRSALPTSVRQFLEFAGLNLPAAEPPILVPVPDGRRVLVLAPHMDDEAAGCGGTICLHVRAGAAVTVAYLTDGRLGQRGFWDGSIPADRWPAAQAALVDCRRQEARAAAAVLGVGELLFLEQPDGELAASPACVSRLAELLGRLRPEIVYLPFPADRQRDHVATARIFAQAVAPGHGVREVFAYEAWTPIYPNCMIDISNVADVKREALRCFASQIADNDYLHSILGLNAYRAMFHLRSRGYAEAFYRTTPTRYRRLCRLLVGLRG